MNSNDKGNIFDGVCFIYAVVVIFATIYFLVIVSSFNSQWILSEIILTLLLPLGLIGAPLIGSILIVRRTKDLSIGIRSIIYSFLPLLLLNIGDLLIIILRPSFYPQSPVFVLPFSFLLIVLTSLFASVLLLILFARINFFSFVEDAPRQVLEKKCVRCSELLPLESLFCAFCGSKQLLSTVNNY